MDNSLLNMDSKVDMVLNKEDMDMDMGKNHHMVLMVLIIHMDIIMVHMAHMAHMAKICMINHMDLHHKDMEVNNKLILDNLDIIKDTVLNNLTVLQVLNNLTVLQVLNNHMVLQVLNNHMVLQVLNNQDMVIKEFKFNNWGVKNN